MGGAGARHTGAQLDSFANSERRGERGGRAIPSPAWPEPGPAERSDRGLGAGGRPATSVSPSPERTPLSSARASRADPRARQLFPTSRLPLPLLSPSPLPLLSKPRHQRRRRHTRRSEGRASSPAPRAHTRLLQPARPLPGPAPAPQAPEPGARLTAQRPDSPGCKETFLWPPTSPPPPGSGPTPPPLRARGPPRCPARLRPARCPQPRAPGAPSSGPSNARRRHLRVMSSLWDKCCGLPCLRRDIAPASILALPGERL